MFYTVLALLQKIGKTPTKHSGPISLFDTEFVAKGIFPIDLSKDIQRAFELRQKSDYKVTERFSPERAEEVLEKAGLFLEVVNRYLLAER
jgi:uncharacterized protein (UPF0332 family)